MSTDDHDGLSFAERFQMACTEVSERCHCACQEIKAHTYTWFGKRYGETQEQLDSPESPLDVLRDQYHDWLPTVSETKLNLMSTDVDKCLEIVEVDFLRFQGALDLARLRKKSNDEESNDVSEARISAFTAARALVENIIRDLTVIRDQLGLAAPDVTSEIEKIESNFALAPSASNDRDDWEYIILKQVMEYLLFCHGLFEQLELRR